MQCSIACRQDEKHGAAKRLRVAAAYWRLVEEAISGKEVSPTSPPAAEQRVKLPPDRAQVEQRLVPDNTAELQWVLKKCSANRSTSDQESAKCTAPASFSLRS